MSFLKYEIPSNTDQIQVAWHDLYKIEFFLSESFGCELFDIIRMSRERSSKKLVNQHIHSINLEEEQHLSHTSCDTRSTLYEIYEKSSSCFIIDLDL